MGLVQTSKDFDCDWQWGFNPLPGGEGGCVGYLLQFDGMGGLALHNDLYVSNPHIGGGPMVVRGRRMISCIGLIESIRWGGDDDDPIGFICHVSKDNAANIRAKLASRITNTSGRVGWYVINFSEDTNLWKEAFHPLNYQPVAACLDKGGEFRISNQGQLVPGHGSKVFKFEFQIMPAAGHAVMFSFDSLQKLQKECVLWGSSDDD